MILYHVITTYHLMEAWTHSLLNYSKESDKIVLLYDDVLLDKYPNVEKISDFDYFFPISYRKSPRQEGRIPEWIEDAFSEINFCEIDEIYVAGAQFYFSEYLIKHNISFVYLEEASGRLSKPEVVMENDKVLNMCRYNIAFTNGMYTGDNPCVKYRIGNKNAQLKDFDFSNCIHFDLIDGLNSLDKESIKYILSFFGAPSDLHIDNDSAVVLTQHFTNLRMMSMRQQRELYQDTIDYYLEKKNVIFKLHPDDQVYYLDFIPENNIISTKFPSELLPFIFDSSIPLIATISSTGIFSFESICNNTLYFDTVYEHNYIYNPLFYASLAFVSLNCPNQTKILYLGINQSQLKNMIRYCDISNDYSIADDVAQIDSCDVIIVDSFDYFSFFDFAIDYENKLIIVLDVSFISVIENREITKFLYNSLVIKEIYEENRCPNCHKFGIIGRKIKMEALNFNGAKNFNCSNNTISINATSDIENELLITRGMLQATEERLKYYIEKDKIKDEV